MNFSIFFLLLTSISAVKVYHLQYKLSTLGVSFNTYHSAIAFKSSSNEIFIAEVSPKYPENVSALIHPIISSGIDECSNVGLIWNNSIKYEEYAYVPAKFENSTLLGSITNNQYESIKTWIRNYTIKYPVFDAFQVNLISDNSTVLESNMCHDFVDRVIRQLYTDGFKPDFKGIVLRDHIVLYVKSIEEISNEDEIIVEYFKLFNSFADSIADDFFNIRKALVTVKSLDIQPIIYHSERFWRITLTDNNNIDYIYAAVHEPPRRFNMSIDEFKVL